MAIYRRFRVQQKYVNGQPTEEYRLGVEVDGTNYHSLEACQSGSECTELEYRWVDMELASDYYCEGTNKYKKQKKQQKCVTEEAWTDVYPYEYQKGDLIEHDSVDCGYEPSVGYHIYGTTDGHGNINISPSKEYYSSTDIVTITTLPSTDYMFSCYNYGSTSEYGQNTTNSTLMLTMTHDWYVSAVFSYSLSSYYLYTLINGEGSIMVTPSKYAYSQQENVNILAFPSANYMFENYEYGSTPAYGSTRLRADLDLTMSNNWYVKANFVYGTATSGSLYYSYTTGTESWYYWSETQLSKYDNDGTHASIIIDYGGVIKAISSSAFYNHDNLTKIILPNCLYVSSWGFEDCQDLTTVNLPNCLTIDWMAFENCWDLTSVNLSNCSYVSGYAFASCFSLLSINLPNCKYIDDYAFVECSALPSIDLPNCSYVGYGAFESCKSLQFVNLPICSIVSSGAFVVCPLLSSIVMPNCTYIGYSAFKGCKSLTSINLPLCSYIADDAFSGCSALSFVNLQNCSYVGGMAFYGCKSLTSIDLPLCSDVNASAFATCYSLISVNLPLCTELGWNAFGGCHSLTTINLPNCSYIGDGAFTYCSSLPFINLPKCTYIKSRAFQNCYVLTSVDLPLCSYVDSYVFAFCSSLISVNLPLCEYVGNSAFLNCVTLKSISLPNCSYISDNVFRSCYNLSLVHLPKVTYIGSSAFYSSPIEALYMDQITSVPSGGNPSINRSYIKSIFIPSSLLDSFVSHSIWSKYSSYFVCV